MTGLGHWAGLGTNLASRWQRLSLANQFAVAGSVVLALATLGIGWWVTGQIEASVVRNSANASALYMDSFISPLSQNLATETELSPGAHRALAGGWRQRDRRAARPACARRTELELARDLAQPGE